MNNWWMEWIRIHDGVMGTSFLVEFQVLQKVN